MTSSTTTTTTATTTTAIVDGDHHHPESDCIINNNNNNTTLSPNPEQEQNSSTVAVEEQSSSQTQLPSPSSAAEQKDEELNSTSKPPRLTPQQKAYRNRVRCRAHIVRYEGVFLAENMHAPKMRLLGAHSVQALGYSCSSAKTNHALPAFDASHECIVYWKVRFNSPENGRLDEDTFAGVVSDQCANIAANVNAYRNLQHSYGISGADNYAFCGTGDRVYTEGYKKFEVATDTICVEFHVNTYTLYFWLDRKHQRLFSHFIALDRQRRWFPAVSVYTNNDYCTIIQ